MTPFSKVGRVPKESLFSIQSCRRAPHKTNRIIRYVYHFSTFIRFILNAYIEYLLQLPLGIWIRGHFLSEYVRSCVADGEMLSACVDLTSPTSSLGTNDNVDVVTSWTLHRYNVRLTAASLKYWHLHCPSQSSSIHMHPCQVCFVVLLTRWIRCQHRCTACAVWYVRFYIDTMSTF